MKFYVDGNLWETDSGLSAPFNQPFFFIMNLAVGGNYVGNPSVAAIKAGTAFPQAMQVDYVRVYEPTAAAGDFGDATVGWQFELELADQHRLPFAGADQFAGWRQLV